MSIARNRLKSVIARVTRRRAAGGYEYTIAGAAWGGPAPIKAVEVQVDGGTWQAAKIIERHADTAWLLWSFEWSGATPGHHTLVSRATNTRGEIQPTREQLRETLISNREDNSQWQRSVTIDPAA
jgi:hypothetical protein